MNVLPSPIFPSAAKRTSRTYPQTLVLFAIGLAIVGGLGLLVDLPVATWLKSHKLPGSLTKFMDLSEVFGHTAGAATILLAATLLDPSLDFTGAPLRRLLTMIAATFSGGLATDVIKLLIPRLRPRATDLAEHASALATFWNVGAETGSNIRSFPSGHAAVAAGLTAALCWKYPRGTPLFVVIGAAAATQRLTSSAHFVSDICTGSAIALLLAAFWIRRNTAATLESG